MFAKLAILLGAVTLTALGLLMMRQQRMEMAHDIARSYRQIDAHRQVVWELQARVTRQVQPETLRAAVAQANLQLEPITPTVVPAAAPGGPAAAPQIKVADRSTRRSRGD